MKLKRHRVKLLEVRGSSREGLEAGAGQERSVDVGIEVQRFTEAEQVQEASITIVRGWSRSLVLQQSLGEVPEERRGSGALDVRRRLSELVREDDCSSGGDLGLRGSKPSSN